MRNRYTHISPSYILVCRYKVVISRVKQAFITLLAQSVSGIHRESNFMKLPGNKMSVGKASSATQFFMMSRFKGYLIPSFPTGTIPGGFQWII